MNYNYNQLLVISWLETIPSPKAEQHDKMAAPHGSPSKRQRQDDSDDESESQAPTAFTTLPSQTLPYSLSRGALTSQSGKSKTGTSDSRRSKSPTKKVADLYFFSESVVYRALNENVQLPPSIIGLARDIDGTQFGEGIFPSSIKVCPASKVGKLILIYLLQDEIVAIVGRCPSNAWGTDANPEQARHVFAQLQEVRAATEESTRWKRSEAAWNLLVHWPMLKIALSDLDNVRVELM